MRRIWALLLVSYAFLAIVGSTNAAHGGRRREDTVVFEPDPSKIVYIVSFQDKPVVAEYSDVYSEQSQDPSTDGNLQRSDPSGRSRRASRRKESRDYASQLRSKQDAFLKKNLKTGKYKKVHSYTHVTNAICLELTSQDQVEKLRSTPGVVRVEQDYLLRGDTTHTPDLLGLNSARGGWNLAAGGQGSAGENVVIGMVDTGISPGHPSFSDQDQAYGPPPASYSGTCSIEDSFPAGSCNNKLIGARYFAETASAYGIIDPVDDFVSPLDGDGHGTHTSAIAGGNSGVIVTTDGINFGTASGIAPRARLATYKCSYRNGGFMSDCVAAIDQAVQDGVNVISMSLGPSSPPGGVVYLGSLDVALLAAVKAGVVVVQSAGNYGPYAGTVTSFSPWVISVGAANTDRTYPVYLDLIDGNTTTTTVVGASFTNPVSLKALISSADVVNANYSSDDTSGLLATDCQDSGALDADQVAGKLLICFYSDNFDSGVASFDHIGWTAAALNAAGFVLVASDPNLALPISFDAIPFNVPGLFIQDLAQSQTVMNYYNSHPGTATASIRVPSNFNAEFKTVSPVVASYSSRGPTPSNGGSSMETADVLKPDVIAPGSQIWSAWTQAGVDLPNWVSDFATLSGTSMAAPHVSGVVALLRQKYPSWSVAAIHSALMTSATLTGSDGTAIKAMNDQKKLTSATPFDMGAGFLNPTSAFDPGLVFDTGYQDYINFICSVTSVNPSTVQSLTGTSCNTTAGSKPSDLNTPAITIAKLQGQRNVTRLLTSVASATETYTTTSTVLSGVSMAVSPTSFTIAPGATVSVKVTIKTTSAQKVFKFGRITWTGNRGHKVSIPVSVNPFSLT